MIVKENIRDFDLEHIFDCGQCFRWEVQPDGSYTGIASGRPPTNVAFYPYEGKKFEGKLVIDNAKEADFDEFWYSYFDFARDYGEIKNKLREHDPIMSKAIDFGQGIRILKQDKWETLISFIISQNNNITRIKGCISTLCENFGEYAGEYKEKKYFDMPTAEVLAGLTEQDLAVCKLGYRAKYLIETAKVVKEDNYKKLRSMDGVSAGDAFEYLTSLSGVGPKVANCIMLFSMNKYERFPIDVWVKKAMNKFYDIDIEGMDAMAQYAAENFKEIGGFAQQYLFYYMKSVKSPEEGANT